MFYPPVHFAKNHSCCITNLISYIYIYKFFVAVVVVLANLTTVVAFHIGPIVSTDTLMVLQFTLFHKNHLVFFKLVQLYASCSFTNGNDPSQANFTHETATRHVERKIVTMDTSQSTSYSF